MSAPSFRQRDTSINLLRGIAIILMLLDHAREFCFGLSVAPTDLAVTTSGLFFTRW